MSPSDLACPHIPALQASSLGRGRGTQAHKEMAPSGQPGSYNSTRLTSIWFYFQSLLIFSNLYTQGGGWSQHPEIKSHGPLTEPEEFKMAHGLKVLEWKSPQMRREKA